MTLRGTPLYLAPEVVLESHFSEKSDVYSFGISVCELFTEKIPFKEYAKESVPRLLIRIAIDGLRPTPPDEEEISSLIKECTSHEPIRRPTFFEINEKFLKILSSFSEDDLENRVLI